jgi:biotin-dependent carboxylase-like uncharacterized protein
MIEILKIGGYATIQDCGRRGNQRFGIPMGGFMDRQSAFLANELLNNKKCTSLIEVFGGHLEFLCGTAGLFAFAGAACKVFINERIYKSPVVVAVAMGETVSIQAFDNGSILYIAAKNGFEVSHTFGSSSTYVPAGFGANHGRELRTGAIIKMPHFKRENSISSKNAQRRFFPRNQTISILKGPEYDLLTSTSQRVFTEASFEVKEVSRMGYRLAGPRMSTQVIDSLSSRYVSRGTIQLPGSGQPIVLMSDAQTTGGYPRIGQILEKDIDLLAQMKFQSRVRFRVLSAI